MKSIQNILGETIRRHWPVATGALLAGIVSLGTIVGEAGVETAIGSDVSADELRALTIESWDRDYSGGGWFVDPVRDWVFDEQFLSPNNLPPGTPRVSLDQTLNWSYDRSLDW